MGPRSSKNVLGKNSLQFAAAASGSVSPPSAQRETCKLLKKEKLSVVGKFKRNEEDASEENLWDFRIRKSSIEWFYFCWKSTFFSHIRRVGEFMWKISMLCRFFVAKWIWIFFADSSDSRRELNLFFFRGIEWISWKFNQIDDIEWVCELGEDLKMRQFQFHENHEYMMKIL